MRALVTRVPHSVTSKGSRNRPVENWICFTSKDLSVTVIRSDR